MSSQVTDQLLPFDRRAIPAAASESFWHAEDGHAIRRIDWPAPASGCRGSILFLPGRGDCYEKYLESLQYWHLRGWRVTASDWRGQSGSGRLGLDAYTGHVDDFSLWVDDLASLWAQWKAQTPGPHVLAAHSMGGHLILRALAEHRVDPDAAVATAPMQGFLNHGIPSVIMHASARLKAALGDPRRSAWKWSEKPGAFPRDRITLLTHDEDRYGDEQWWRGVRPELAMGPGSWGWVERAFASMRGLEKPGVLEAVQVPVLLVATKADKLVSFAAIRNTASRLPKGRLVAFGKEARHEVLREEDGVRDQVLAAIDAFLDDYAPMR